MESLNLAEEIREKFKKVNDVDLREIVNFIVTMPKERAEKTWTAIKRGYESDFPNLAKIRKFLSEEFPPDEKEISVSLNDSANLCDTCKLIYANKKDRYSGCNYCPRCGSSNRTVILNADPNSITYAQDWCWDCDLYKSEEQRGLYGPGCEYFGMNKKMDMCKDCACRACCHKFGYQLQEVKESAEERRQRQEKNDWRRVLAENRESRKNGHKEKSNIQAEYEKE